MSDPALLWIDAGWIAVLGFFALVARREFAMLRALVTANGGSVADGPEVGAVIPRLIRSGGDRLFIFLFGDCAPCHEVADRLHRVSHVPNVEVVVTDGALTNSSKSLLTLIPDHPNLTVLAGPSADQCREALGVHSGPFAVMTRGDVVTAKGYLRGTADILRLANIATGLELVDAHANHGAS